VINYQAQPVQHFPALPARLEQGLYRIAQEAFDKCTQTCSAHSVEMTLTVTDHWVRLVIQDDGQGFEPETLPQRRDITILV